MAEEISIHAKQNQSLTTVANNLSKLDNQTLLRNTRAGQPVDRINNSPQYTSRSYSAQPVATYETPVATSQTTAFQALRYQNKLRLFSPPTSC
ncbi:hypothetical protein F511_08894 [Dorcoceras hygrometricum]|uniref:Uncharacterized protein n=1 Tax=Dorcoceras hygrometricum TaxID=472368 RepID=A0A2Z7B2T7_9LAMI|nr:hypothetical protein F511_08894 [Dorcoceras hygrometricum]